MTAPKTAGYSGTPLAKKLGIREGATFFAMNAPAHYDELLAPLPPRASRARKESPALDVLHVFVTSQAELRKVLARARKTLKPDAAIWVSWPKKASGVATDVTEDRIREIALPTGLVDIKVCAVDEVWSGLKLVVRKELR